ncbi:cytochrome P450 [Streptomyces sp. NPDC023838]|uniref:cytochrome P450 n=1 Tax=Streptomyces sp. NPDC023838 TaxID=3154325 RepID=UPI0033E98B6D
MTTQRDPVGYAAVTGNSALIPKAGGGLPLAGHVLRMLRDPHGFLEELTARGDLVEIRLGRQKVIVVCDPELTRQVLLDDRTFDKAGPIHDRATEVFGISIGTCRHDQHRAQRRMMQPAFHRSRFTDYARIMSGPISATVNSWEAGQVIDVTEESLRFGVMISIETMFGSVLSPPELQRTVADLATIVDGLYRCMLSPPLLSRAPLPFNRRYSEALARFRNTVKVITDRPRTTRTGQEDLLTVLLAAYESADETLLRQVEKAGIPNQVVAFIVAGAEAVGSTLAWSLYMLDRHPELKERLHAEIDEVLAPGVRPGMEHIPQLAFTSSVVSEVLRLYPAGWMFTRAATRDTELGGYAIPAGTVILYSPYLIHRRSDLYPDPNCFNPDRWAPTAAKSTARHAFIPFGAGARKCIGDELGTVEAILALASITRQWDLQLLPGSTVRPVAATSFRPHGLRMRASARRPAEADL